MREVILLVAAAFLFAETGGSRKPTSVAAPVPSTVASASSEEGHVDFDAQVKPILQSRCMPCHFTGGQMYERLPFDRSETIKKLGTRLFTRIRKEDERRLLERFLKQPE